jgi:ABC-2 type transport system ATP-binding protein
LSLLLALARRPEILILDEPTTGLDAVSKQQLFGELLKAVEDGERTVLISSHGLSDIERFADHVGMIKDGKLLLEGRTDEVVDRYRFAEFFTSNGTVIENRDGLIILKRTENRWHALLDQKSRAHNWLQARGAQQISLTRVTLEDLFVALAKEEETA